MVNKIKELIKQKGYEIEFINGTPKYQTDKVTVKCNKCGSFEERNYLELMRSPCSYCGASPKKVNHTNSIRAKKPELVKFLKDEKDADKYTPGSNKKIMFKCPDCGTEKALCIYSVEKQGFGCSSCSDKISVSNKILFNLLTNNNINFENEKMFDWGSRHRYDFFLPEQNVIIELNGIQHYEERSGFTRRSLKEQQDDDLFKKQMAKKNKIKTYLEIDCRDTSFENMEKKLFFDLSKKLNLKLENFKTAFEQSQKTILKPICEDWETGTFTVIELAKKYKFTVKSIRTTLKKGTILGFCYYNGQEEMDKCNNLKAKKVKKTDKDGKIEIFVSQAKARESLEISKCRFNKILEKGTDKEGNSWVRIEPTK